jgi:hypothetical protein
MQFYRDSEPLLNADVELPKLRRPAVGWILLSLGVIVSCSYLIYRPRQDQVESRFAPRLADRLQWYPLESSNAVVTNLEQVLYGSHGGYPYQWHEWFRNFGESAGFAHSLAEKYVLVPPGVFHRKSEIYLVSAQPFLEHGKPRRIVIYKHADDFGAADVDEDSIQTAFEQAGRQIPAPTTAAKPPLPPPGTTRNVRHQYLSAWLETRAMFSRLEWWGMAPRTARIVEKAVCWSLGLACVWIIGYCFWPVAAKGPKHECALAPQLSTARKVWAMIGYSLLFLLIMCFMAPSFGSDRGYGQLYFHLLLPYSAGWEAMPHQAASRAFLISILVFGQIAVYGFALGYAWIRNRLGLAAAIVAYIHILAIAFSVAVVVSTR